MPNDKRWWIGGGLVVGAVLLLLCFSLWRKPVGPLKKRSETAAQPSAEPWKEFSGEKALAHVRALVDLGPRPPASAAIEQARRYLADQLNHCGWQVEEQPFEQSTPGGQVRFVNLIATHGSGGKKEARFLVCSHYDTKTFDTITFVGANDGGSSTGALLELARVLDLHPTLANQIELVFFDGEEAYEQFTETDGLYGSRHFAKQLAAAHQIFHAGILWDMIGDRDLTITLPLDSPPELARGIFAAADALQLRDHFTYYRDDVLDDHTPLNEIGIPTIDLIDFDYPPWHTAEDTIDKLSAESLRIVGAVTLQYLAQSNLR
jgi:glutaminyl-peptide cyclotransferase